MPKIHRYAYNKLVRDKTEERMRAENCVTYGYQLDNTAYIAELIKKLHEEAHEVVTAPAEKKAVELGDLLEVVHALSAAYNISMDHVEIERKKTFEQRGGFAQRYYVTYADVPESSNCYNYLLANKDRYPEIDSE